MKAGSEQGLSYGLRTPAKKEHRHMGDTTLCQGSTESRLAQMHWRLSSPAFHASHTSIDATGRANGTVVWGPRNDTSYFTGSFWACSSFTNWRRRTPASKGWICLQRQPHLPQCPPQPLLGDIHPLRDIPGSWRWKNVLFARSSFPKGEWRPQEARGQGMLQGLLPGAPLPWALACPCSFA